MSNIHFFTPFLTFKQHIQNGIENSFYLGGKSASIIPGTIVGNCQEAILKNKNKIKQAAILISCTALVVLFVKLAAKVIFRPTCPKSPSDLTQTNGPNNSVSFTKTVYPPVDYAVDPLDDPNSDVSLPTPVVQSVLNSSPVLTQADNQNHVTHLMHQFTEDWNEQTMSFNSLHNSFNLQSFSTHLAQHADQFKKPGVDNEQHFGYIEKFDLDLSLNPQIYMRADLHGDLKSLLENIRSLQKKEMLDQNFKCKPGVHLVFLGDYCDRGEYGTQILELLMRLREENPQQVHLIRGNHEYSSVNNIYGRSDDSLEEILDNAQASKNLERFYETMSLTTYFSVDQRGSREYVQCTHGLFELTMDPAPLLDQGGSGDYLPVSKTRQLSGRIRQLTKNNSSHCTAAQRINNLVNNSRYLNTSLDQGLTAYNWADVTEDETRTGYLSARTYKLSAPDIRHYLDLSSEQHRVVMIFRGHQHKFQHLTHNGQVLVTTLPVGMDCPGYRDRWQQPDRAYIIKPTPQVTNWTKRAILRETGGTETELTEPAPLTSPAI